MAEIIKFPFGRKGSGGERQNQDPGSIPEVEQSPEERIQHDLNWARPNLPRILETWATIEKYQIYVKSLEPGWYSAENVEVRRQGLKANSFEQLCRMFLASSEADWKLRPSFYLAVFHELDVRRKAVTELADRKDI
ncbi:MAG TPA: hypothetical protein VGB97_03815 [Candidatus Paceibacterota bacterium]|jgi:hypothetical protein